MDDAGRLRGGRQGHGTDWIINNMRPVMIVTKARDFAERVHSAQKRRYTGEPYFVHLSEVATLCSRHGASDEVVAAAYLHDSMEDQDVSYDELKQDFGRRVADMVVALTDVPAVKDGLTRAERKHIDRMRLSASSGDVQTIKCADLISNTATIVEYDKDFARYYLREKRALLMVLVNAEKTLHDMAWKTLIKAEDRLGIPR